MGPRKPNAKAEAAKERKAAHKATKDAEAAREREKAEAAEWGKGANARGAARADAAAQKADEAARKRREKAELLAQEEASSGSTKIKKAPGAGMTAKKSKSKKKTDLGLLEEALVGNAEKKSRQAKKAEREKKEREDRARAERERKAREEAGKVDPLMANTDAMIGSGAEAVGDDGRELFGRSANVANLDAASASGIEGAISALSVGAAGGEDVHPEKRMKALHRAFEERMMPQMREEYPGLRQAQYKDKIFQLWKKSPENPMNRQV